MLPLLNISWKGKANPHLLNADGETAIENGKQGKKPNEIMQIYEEYFKNNPNLHDDSNESQSPESLWQLGICYSNGTYGYPKDFKKAYQSFQQGSMHGHHPSTTGLGYCYFYGLGVERDYKEAVRLYGVAASKGNVFAAYNLGTLYKSGKILPKNLQRGRVVGPRTMSSSSVQRGLDSSHRLARARPEPLDPGPAPRRMQPAQLVQKPGKINVRFNGAVGSGDQLPRPRRQVIHLSVSAEAAGPRRSATGAS